LNLIKNSGGLRNLFNKIFTHIRTHGLRSFWAIFTRVIRGALPNSYSLNKQLHLESFLIRNDYQKWLAKYDGLFSSEQEMIKTKLANFQSKPLISIIMATYNSNPEWLKDAIESVRGQTYQNWELCIADDASSKLEVKACLTTYAEKDSRIKYILRSENGHISAATNSALELSTGEWAAFLDHDDVLEKNALYWVVEAINRKPNARLFYSDEDKLNGNNHRYDAYFKPDWNRDLFYSHNLICHLAVYYKPMIDAIGGCRAGYEGAQDYDLALRFIEQIEDEQVHHIPRILYHWRAHQLSTASSLNAKDYAEKAGLKSLTDHFQRLSKNVEVTCVTGGYRVHYLLPPNPPKVSVIIPTYNAEKLVRQCIESILQKTTYSNYEILLVDNNSDDESAIRYFSQIETKYGVKVIQDRRPFNYSAINNSAVNQASGDLILLLNNDIEVISPEWLSELVSFAIQPGVGAVGAKLLYPNNTIQHAGVITGIGGVAGHSHKHLDQKARGYFSRAQLISSFSAVTAACLVVKKEIFLAVGGLNEAQLAIAFNDVDLCLKIREAGYRNIFTPYAVLYHHESATRGLEDSPEKKLRFLKEINFMKAKWGDALVRDPAYSPNLTLDYEDFSFAWPPRV